MRKRHIISMIAGLTALCGIAAAAGVDGPGKAFLRPLQQRDSVLIADQLLYGFELQGVEDGTQIGLPDFSKGFRDSVEIVRNWQVDTLTKPKKTPRDIRASIIITSFEEGTYDLPALGVVRMTPDGRIDTLHFDPQVLEVKTMPVDTATFEIHDIKGQIRYPVTFKEILPYLVAALILAAIIALAVWLIQRRRLASHDSVSNDPAHIVALRKLDRFRGDKFWAPEKQKAYYSGITDALRFYMADRFGIDAMEMTTAEIFDALKGDSELAKDLYSEAKELFETADFVKFAKHTVDDDTNAKALPAAVRFIMSTYIEETKEEDK